MVSFESMRSWRRQGSAGAFSGGVAVLLLGLSLVQPVSAQSVCPAAQTPQNLTQPEYHDQAEAEEGFMKALVQSFLHTVQPRDLPIGLIKTIVDDASNGIFRQEIIKEIALYEAGFLVCAVIGILYIILMPIVGFFVACCRCCGNCGGEMYQKQSPSIHCRRRTLYWCTFAITGIILAGNVCMFISNNDLEKNWDLVLEELNNTIDNTNTFVSAVPQQIRDVEVGAYDTIDEVDRNLKEIGPQLGGKIQQRLGQVLNPVLQSVELLDNETVSIDGQINELNSSLAELQNNMSHVQANLTAVKNSIDRTFDGCTGCGAKPVIPELTLDTNIFIQNLKELQSAVNEVKATNVSSKIQEEKERYFNTIPETVTNQTKDVVQEGQRQLYDVKVQIRSAIEEFPIGFLNNTSDNLDRVKEGVGSVTPLMKFIELTRWRVCLVLCCAVLLVVVCNFLGLILGPVGLKPKADPKKRSCTADCGGIFFMIGAGFSFLYSWLLMIIVLVLFLLGGNAYTLVCEPWSNGELLQVIDTPGVIPGFNISELLGIKTDITVSDIYSDCSDNKTLWTTFHLNDIVNLDELFNVSHIQQNFESPNISLPTINLLSEDVKNQLSSFSTNAKDFDPTSITQQINNISSINLTTVAVMLENLADDPAQSPEIKSQLQAEAINLRTIQSEIDTVINPQLVNLNTTTENLQSTVWKINGTVGEVLRNVDTTQNELNTNTTQIVQSESQAFLDCQVEQFTVYADWATLAITEQLGRCGPMAEVVNTSEIVACYSWLESFNAFWFSFGWCLIFFIPSIIFSMKLAKHYRKMKHSDVYDDHIIMNPIPRAQTKYA